MLEEKSGAQESSEPTGGGAQEIAPSEDSQADLAEAGSEQESDGGELVQTQPDVAALMAERDRALAEKIELLEKFQRAQAEFENVRKRLVREKEETVEYAAMETIRSLLPVVDDLERARQTPQLHDEVRKGLDLIHEQMMELFSRAGLKAVDEEGKFDPNYHHAVDKQPVEDDEDDQTIIEVYQRGYQFKDRLLRPAMVKVAVKE